MWVGSVAGIVALEQLSGCKSGEASPVKIGEQPTPTLCSERKKKERALRKGWGTLILVGTDEHRHWKGGAPGQFLKDDRRFLDVYQSQ
jgi:hypothetical protein